MSLSPLAVDPLVQELADALRGLSAEDLREEPKRRLSYYAAGFLQTRSDLDARALVVESDRRGRVVEPIWLGAFPDRTIDLVHLSPADVDFELIARQLARLPRFNATTAEPYSIAQHSVLVMDVAPRQFKPWAILHDAHEGFLGDWIRPAVQYVARVADELSGTGDSFRRALSEAKRRLDRVIFAAAGIGEPSDLCREQIRIADRFALRTEHQNLLGFGPDNMRRVGDEPREMPPCFNAHYWSAEKAEREFLAALKHHGII